MAELFPVSESILQAPAAPRSSQVRQPVWRVTIEGKDVTREISPSVVSITYTDATHGESDSLALTIEDAAGRWRGDWYPDRNAKIELLMGYAGEPLLPCGRFSIDQTEIGGPPDVITIQALAAGKKPSYRTKRSTAYESQTLRQIAGAVAKRHELRLVGEIREIRIARVTQNQEEDLTFLARIASAYGYVFNVRDNQLIFHELAQLEAAAPAAQVRRTEVRNYRLTHRLKGIYKSVELRYHDSALKEMRKAEAEAKEVKTGDVYKTTVRAENQEQAEAKAKALLRRLNSRAYEGQITVEGNPRLVAGANATLSGFGHFDGKYQIRESVHRMARSLGYETTVHVRTVS